MPSTLREVCLSSNTAGGTGSRQCPLLLALTPNHTDRYRPVISRSHGKESFFTSGSKEAVTLREGLWVSVLRLRSGRS